ncbi:aldehyde dehydrogenase family protein [Rhodococcus sp. NPDC127530]|uniref:aldehyde dehydrogenase family protein n=1 Tax=unclassified Rhodococcus (in: high G+C Gram-positive bacteria) TaxID=192944 RepID=UPI00362F91EF
MTSTPETAGARTHHSDPLTSSGVDRVGITDVDKITLAFHAQRAAVERSPIPTLDERKANLLKLQRLIEQNALLLKEAADADFGTRSGFETELSEIVGTISTIRYIRGHLKSWMAPRRRSASMWFKPAKNRIEPSPLGVVGVVSPWNFPVHLALIPAASALAAGNRVMVKLSEFTPATSAVIKRLVSQNFDPAVFYVSDGGTEVASAFTQLPFDHLFFTGSTAVGKIVATTAAQNLTPVTLELGGKSPVIIDENYSIKDAATAVAWGKLYNGGQVCISPDYVLVPKGRETEFAQATIEAARVLYPNAAGNADYTAILNQRYYDRLRGFIEEADSNGWETFSTEDPELGRSRRQLPLTAIVNPPADSTVMTEEIFGPILPVVGYDTQSAAIATVTSKSTPLAMYLLCRGSKRQRSWLDRVPSGSAVVNDVMIGYIQNDLPFGGRGGSGMGSYHAREGFDTFSHLRPVVYQRAIFGHTGVQMLYPPYSPVARLLLKAMRRT